jgi:hypothetical protein
VICLPNAPRQISVRWPDGEKAAFAVPDGAREVTVSRSGVMNQSK